MATELRNTRASLIEDLKQNAHRFSFEMAAYILEYGAPVSFGKEISVSQAPFKTVSINSFHLRCSEIEKIREIDGVNAIFIERLSISGLNAPLPTPYAEIIFRRTREKDFAMASFVNIFNSRLLGISYQISKRRYLCLQDHRNGNCPFVKAIAAFLGENPETMERRFSRVAYLFWIKEKSAAGLEALLASIFQFETKVRQFQTIWCDIDEDNRLGDKNFKLGVNSGLGKKTSTSSLGVDIELTHSDYAQIYRLLTDKKYLNDMKYLIREYLGEFFFPRIMARPKKAPPLRLSTNDNPLPILGKTAWLPSTEHDMDYAMVT